MEKRFNLIITENKKDEIFYVGIAEYGCLEKEHLLCESYGDTFDEAVQAGYEVLSLYLADSVENGSIPDTRQDIKLKDGQVLVPVFVDPVYIASRVNGKLVKKTLNIPEYLNILGENKKVNFSRVLEKALKKELNLK